MRHIPSLLVAVVVLTSISEGADAAAPVPPASSLCGSSANLARAVGAIIGSTATPAALRSLARSSIAIIRSSGKIQIDLPAGRHVAAQQSAAGPHVCFTHGEDAVLFDTADRADGTMLAAYAAALAFRHAHPWPTKYPAHALDPETTAFVVQRGAYQYVAFMDYPERYHMLDSCLGEEFYRVDPNTYQVRAYNGCLVGGDGIPLPRISELPT